jgi:hypothetical protein
LRSVQADRGHVGIPDEHHDVQPRIATGKVGLPVVSGGFER